MKKISLESANKLLKEKGFEVELTYLERLEILELEKNRKREISDSVHIFLKKSRKIV